jgi:hypothetical protein
MIPTLVVAGITLALFFRGAGDRYGFANDLFSALALLLLVPPILAVYILYRDQVGAWLLAISIISIGGIGIGAGGQILLVARVISLNTSFITGGIAVVLLIPWVAGFLALSFQPGPLPAYLGRLLLGVTVFSVVLILTSSLHWQAATWVSSILLLLALCAWAGTFGAALLRLARP